MKRFLKTMALMLVLSFVACTNNEELAPKSLDVTPNNVAGIWKLDELNGDTIPDGLYCYIQFVRKERKFKMYQKFDSMYPRCITGTFSITKDDHKGYILDGKYDYGTGNWNNAYIVKSLFAESMLLAADVENGDLCKYIRCNEIPAEILDRFESEE